MEFNNNFDYSKDIEITPAFARIHKKRFKSNKEIIVFFRNNIYYTRTILV